MRRTIAAAAAAAVISAGTIVGVTAPSDAVSCTWQYRKPLVTGWCGSISISLTYTGGRLLTGFIGRQSVSVTHTGRLWSGFVGGRPVTVTRMSRGQYSGIVGGRGVACSGSLPVGCLV